MTTAQMRAASTRQTNVANRVADKVKDALRHESLIESGALSISARVAGTAAAAVASLPAEARRKLNSRERELMTRIRGLVEAFGVDPASDKIVMGIPTQIETSKGAGLGSVVSAEEGERLLSDYAIARRLEDWAGPVLGATELSRDYGIPRSTLNHWQHGGDVIGLLKGTKKHVYPIEQFIDGRPAKGIAEINTLVPNPRTAWLWLSRNNPVLAGRKPIDLMKQDRVEEVLEAARDYFAQA